MSPHLFLAGGSIEDRSIMGAFLDVPVLPWVSIADSVGVCTGRFCRIGFRPHWIWTIRCP